MFFSYKNTKKGGKRAPRACAGPLWAPPPFLCFCREKTCSFHFLFEKNVCIEQVICFVFWLCGDVESHVFIKPHPGNLVRASLVHVNTVFAWFTFAARGAEGAAREERQFFDCE